MTLVHRWVTPPLWLKEQSNELFVNLGGPRRGGVVDGDAQPTRRSVFPGFLEQAKPMIAYRRRLFLSDVADVESLCNV